ncbi:MAG: hypothetical protein NW220_22710 [Leptolyngbyaceae cyanobacterium bins.349]|nr:hypothetical protein [Leptolyngbyaceae cyanobacterium bins.349]
MTAIFPHPSKQFHNSSSWQTVLVLVLAFWLSSTVLIDGLVMPSLYAGGILTEPGFAPTGYALFWILNRVELLCAALVLTSVLVLRYTRSPLNRPGLGTLLLASLLVAIALIDTYALTPTMSALGLCLNWFSNHADTPAGMDQLHLSYWLLDLVKVAAGGMLLWLHNRATSLISQE